MGTIFATAPALPRKFGSGIDGNITVNSGSVDIADIYENDTCSGVTTKRGVNKGLNHGAGSYNPALNQNSNTAKGVPNAINFTIATGATLTCTAWGTGTDNKLGVIWIACREKFINNGTIQLNNLGGAGGAGGNQAPGAAGVGSGGAQPMTLNYQAGLAGAAYGSTTIPLTTWANIYGSGGGGGGGYKVPEGSGGSGGGGGCATVGQVGQGGGNLGGVAGTGVAGGAGGGAFRLYAKKVDVSGGTISADGESKAGINDDSGNGGGGSGGTVYIETLFGATLGTNKISCTAGTSGANGGRGGGGSGTIGGLGSGAYGRIHIAGSYTGSTNSPAIA